MSCLNFSTLWLIPIRGVLVIRKGYGQDNQVGEKHRIHLPAKNFTQHISEPVYFLKLSALICLR